MSTFRGSKYRGQFWFPAHPATIARGELAIDKDGNVQLAIEGSGKLGVFLGETSPRTIWGRIWAEYDYNVTLFDTFNQSSRTKRTGVENDITVTANIVCSGLLIAHHITGLDEPQFGQADVGLSCLSEWSRLFGISGKAALTGNARAIKQKNQKSRPVLLNDDSKVSFITNYEGPILFNRVKAVTLSETDYVRIECPHQETINQVWQRAHAIRSLVGFGMRRATYMEDIILSLPDGGRAVFIFPKSSGGDSVPAISPLFTRPALSKRMSRYLRNWHDHFQKLETVLALTSSADYQIGTYFSFRFLSYVQALETFHRRMRRGRFEDHESYKPTLAALKGAVPRHLHDDYRKRIEAGLIHQ
jgi:hypothetical protein